MSPLWQVAGLFLRLGLTSFGGPAAHVVLIERECVERRRWITREQFIDLLGVANLIPGPTSTELAMHVGRQHAGWPGLVVAGVAFITPAALLVGALAAVYVRLGDLPATQALLAAVQPVVVVIVLQGVVPLARSAIRSGSLALLSAAAAAAALSGVPEIYLLLAAGIISMLRAGMDSKGPSRRPRQTAAIGAVLVALGATSLAAARQVADAAAPDVFGYFVRVGSLLFGSGYVLLSVLHGDLVERLGWLTDRQLLDAIAAGQATPGPVFTTATFIGYVLGGPRMALIATVGIFLPAFVFSSLSSVVLPRLRASRHARAFLDGVNAAAVALIAVVLVSLAYAAFTGPIPVVIGLAAALAIFLLRLTPTLVLLAAAAGGALSSLL
jgi:chromate transporter